MVSLQVRRLPATVKTCTLSRLSAGVSECVLRMAVGLSVWPCDKLVSCPGCDPGCCLSLNADESKSTLKVGSTGLHPLYQSSVTDTNCLQLMTDNDIYSPRESQSKYPNSNVFVVKKKKNTSLKRDCTRCPSLYLFILLWCRYSRSITLFFSIEGHPQQFDRMFSCTNTVQSQSFTLQPCQPGAVLI